ncbi:S8 family serine peptidase [Pleionea sp. CnH1-48]|uniref:S8 family serine peptidase n=1 Tax=Pleionea sp. CnH1-48 TaxID=2954494 RepID=UPI0020983DED|nr:S8 family serine peptidase [Pleionea sp. CnH1-48]MCO7224197.1 S8 family serine peptidase [Pleionea sp. CnH1-48]
MKLSKVALATGVALGMGITSVAAESESRYIVTYKDKTNNGRAAMQSHGGRSALRLNRMNAEAVYMTETNANRLKSNPHIKQVERDQKRYALAVYNDDIGNPMTEQLTPYAVYQSQANQVPFNAGAGMKVCVIDSGLDNSNPDFNWANITGDNDSGTGNWFEHGGPHGTHVAGTVGAADNNVGVVGMAPGVSMHIIKVFNASGWGYSSDLAHAADLCTQAGANIITMSLGGGGSNSTESGAFQAFTDAGGLVLAAAGNDGNSVRSYPAGYTSVMMVGANDADNNIADFSQYPSCKSGRGRNASTDERICVEVTAGGVDTLSTYPAGMATSASTVADNTNYASSAMENTGAASGNTFFMGTAEATDSNAQGKVCVIDRGNISFHDKVANCENSGGVGAIIINNEPGMLYGTLGDTNSTSIPAVGAAQEDRSALVAANNASVTVSASDYGYMSGTSMATPAVAGIAALVWSNHPSCNGTHIRNALKASAEDQGQSGHDVYFGHGIVKAADAHAYLQANGCTDTPPEPEPEPCKGGPKKCG